MGKVLSDSKLEHLLKKGTLEFYPKVEKEQVKPASIDLRLGRVYDEFGNELNADSEGIYHLMPKTKYYIETLERVRTGANKNYSFYIIPRSSFSRALINIFPTDGNYARGPLPKPENIRCSLENGPFNINVRKGDSIIQLVVIKGNNKPARSFYLRGGEMRHPLANKAVTPANGIRDDELFLNIPIDYVVDKNTPIKYISDGRLDYSDAKHAAIVYSTDYGSKINVSYVDPGYSGTLFGLFMTGGSPQKINLKGKLLKIQEYEIHGKVKKDYNKSDSHYK